MSLFRRRNTRVAGPQGTSPIGVCGYLYTPWLGCGNPSVHHHIVEWAGSPTGFKSAEACDDHQAYMATRTYDTHPLGPCCQDRYPQPVWLPSTGNRPGFCYHPEQEKALHAELARVPDLRFT